MSPCPTPGLIIQGSKDTISLEKDSYELYQKILAQNRKNTLCVEYEIIEFADHFFSDTQHMNQLLNIIQNYVTPKTVRQIQQKKVRRDRKKKFVEISPDETNDSL